MTPFAPFSLNIAGRLVEFASPQVMAILNVTPDSFYSGSRCGMDEGALCRRVEQLVEAGADIIDVGGCSTRPGFQAPDADEEWQRVAAGIAAVRAVAANRLVSVDTFRSEVALKALDAGADIINDVSAMSVDESMRQAVISAKVPYILTHPSASSVTPDMRGDTLVAAVIDDLARATVDLTQAGVSDIIIDPGFGFGKTVEQNLELLGRLDDLSVLGRPILVGVSRKSMITKSLNIDTAAALNATTVLDTMALMRGAAILRVHDVAEAREAVKLLLLTLSM